MAKYSNLEKVRLEKLNQLTELGIDPYPRRINRTHTVLEASDEFLKREKNQEEESIQATLVGRIRSLRPMGKIIFAHIEDGSGRIQLFFRANDIGEEQVNFFKDHFDLGDYVQAEGKMFRTKSGEISLWISQYSMLAKSITPLPAAKDEIVDGEIVKHATITDPETRYRQRYDDFTVHPQAR